MEDPALRKSIPKEKVLRSREEYVTLSIPKPLFDRAKRAIQGTGFRSVTEYAVFLLRESVSLKPGDSVRERLKALGYID